MFQDDNDKAAKKAREAEAHKKRQQNALPSWHAWSTVSGEMTTLGAEAAKRQEMPVDAEEDGDGEVLENDFGDECKCCWGDNGDDDFVFLHGLEPFMFAFGVLNGFFFFFLLLNLNHG